MIGFGPVEPEEVGAGADAPVVLGGAVAVPLAP